MPGDATPDGNPWLNGDCPNYPIPGTMFWYGIWFIIGIMDII